MTGKFHAPRDAFLYQLTLDGSTETSGHIESPTGWFAKISIDTGEVDVLTAEYSQAIADTGTGAVPVGHFLLVEDSDGFVDVTEYPSANALAEAYSQREGDYTRWDAT